jgi:hypothetical protein
LTRDKEQGKIDLRDIETAAREQGWRVERARNGHPRFYSPNQAIHPISFSGTPSDVRSIRNLLAELRRNGFIWPWSARDRRKAKKE